MVKRSGVAIIMVGATLAVVFTLFAWEARRSQHSTSAHSTFPRTGAVTVSPPRSAVVFYKSPSLSTILEHTAINAEDGGRGIPDDQTVCFAYGLGKDALHEPVSWSVSDFTNLRVADRLADQAGVNGAPTGYGSTACQVRGTSMGFLVNKDTSPRVASYYGLSLAYSFGSGAAYRPWSSAYPPDAELRLETYYANGRRRPPFNMARCLLGCAIPSLGKAFGTYLRPGTAAVCLQKTFTMTASLVAAHQIM